MSIYLVIFLIVTVPLILNIKINELSNKIIELDNDILDLEIRKIDIYLDHHEKYSISNIEKLAKSNLYERLEISQKVNKLEIPYKLKKMNEDKITVLGFGS